MADYSANFTFELQDVKDRMPNILLLMKSDVLIGFMAQGKQHVENELLKLIYEKFRQAGKLLPDDLPDDRFDVFLADAYPEIREMMVYKTLQYAFAGRDEEKSEMWASLCKETDLNKIVVFIDVNEDDEISSDEFVDFQALIDGRII